MTVRTGVFTKYVLEFPSLTVSNDLLAGDMCIDADVSVTMSRWTTGSTFTITLYDLPEAKVKSLAGPVSPLPLPVPLGAPGPAAPPRVKIKLGYLDTAVGLVLDGVYESVDSSVTGDKLVTTVKGREAAVYACKKTPLTAPLSGQLSYADAAKNLLSNPKLPPNCVAATPNVDLPGGATLDNLKFTAKTVLQALDELAKRANAELLIADGKVFFGAPVRYDDVTPSPLDYAATLAKFDPLLKLAIPGTAKPGGGDAPPDKPVKGFQFTIAGDPSMRPGQTVTVAKIKDYVAANPAFRIRDVKHVYSAAGGYSCVGNATEELSDGTSARQVDTMIGSNADTATRDLTDRIRSQAAENPAIEIAAVKAAADKYRADLYYGQSADGNETQPSVNVAVDQQEDHVYQGKPIASPFAWRKCGLVTPVYPGMKAVVLHNRASASDGIVSGYVWSKQPDFAPPESQAGDWWLCLPVDFDATQPPGDSTKAANDLTGNNGKRVVEVKGLKITVGSGKLGTVGTRPTQGDDDEFLIEHSSGTSVHIDSSGALTIDASSSSFTIKGDVVIQGSLEIK
jgi:hypothetical protein